MLEVMLREVIEDSIEIVADLRNESESAITVPFPVAFKPSSAPCPPT